MSRSSIVLIDSLKRGQIFYEVDHGVAVKWLALEDAKKEGRSGYSCLCQRQSGVQIVFQDCSANCLNQAPRLFNYADPNLLVIE